MDEYQIGPGTAGLAQRISPIREEKSKEENLYVLRPNRLMPCSQNQY